MPPRWGHQEGERLLQLLDCIRMHYEYILSGHAFAVRDEYMAENAAWIMG